MLTELQTLVGESATSTTLDPRKLGSAAGVIDLASRHGIWRLNQIEVSIGDFVRHGEHHEGHHCNLLAFIADNEDAPDIVKRLLRAGLRKSILTGGGASPALTLEMREFVLVGGNIPTCYCGNAKDFGDCTRDGYPRPKPASCRYCQVCGRFFDRHGQVLGSVERCHVDSTRLRCQCGRTVSKVGKPWARDASTVDCEHCGRKIHVHSGLVLGKRDEDKRTAPSRK